MARTPIHPGEHLAEELKEPGISAAALARQIDAPVNRITGITNGQRGITADTALRLGHWFETSPDFWLNLQKLYELRSAQKEVANRWRSSLCRSQIQSRAGTGLSYWLNMHSYRMRPGILRITMKVLAS